jgi:hypothetical protein
MPISTKWNQHSFEKWLVPGLRQEYHTELLKRKDTIKDFGVVTKAFLSQLDSALFGQRWEILGIKKNNCNK